MSIFCSKVFFSFNCGRAVASAPSSATCAPPTCTLAPTPQLRGHRALPHASNRIQRMQVVCMAHPRRVARVASQIQREVGELFVTDPVIQTAICPERRLGDDTLSAIASITNTYVSNDLQVVKVFVSVYSDDYGKRVAMENLQRLEPYVRRIIGQRVRLRLTPEVRFVYDDSEEEADLVARVIGRDEMERYRSEIEAGMTPGRRQEGENGAEGQAAAQGEADEDEDEEDGEYDMDELYDDPDEAPQVFPDPFADMFRGDGGGELLQQRTQGRRGKDRRKGGGRKGKKGERQDGEATEAVR